MIVLFSKSNKNVLVESIADTLISVLDSSPKIHEHIIKMFPDKQQKSFIPIIIKLYGRK